MNIGDSYGSGEGNPDNPKPSNQGQWAQWSGHGDRPNEISLPPMTTKTTTITFDKPGELTFICHFPGHEAYGMVGVLRVHP